METSTPDSESTEIPFAPHNGVNGKRIENFENKVLATLTKAEEAKLKQLNRSVLAKYVTSPETLLEESVLRLHLPHSDLPEKSQKLLENLHRFNASLANRKVLVTDDDIRNIFAMTSILERHQMIVVSAENGKDAIEILKTKPDIDVVLMDIMMPGMDGYDTMREIRKHPEFEKLPIIAVTAKAMKGDREKCIEAGASDYIAKPVDTERLISLLRMWLYQMEAKEL